MRRCAGWVLVQAATVGAAILMGTAVSAQTPVVEYYHLGALGSVRAVTNAAGAVVSRHEYEPFGEEWPPVVPPTTARQFTGKERDPETGLDYFGARYYRADLGQFTTVDPFLDPSTAMGDPQQWNRYAYARGNPLKYTDPNGKWIETLWDAANVAMGAKSAYDSFRAGHVLSGVVDTGGAIVDLAAAIVPIVPGGVGTAIKAARAAERIDDAVDAAKGAENAKRLVIGRGADLAKPGALGPGEYKLSWPPTGAVRTEWRTNSGLLREEMRNLRPIRDASIGNDRGMYLNAERYLLKDRGWTLNEGTGLWMPPR